MSGVAFSDLISTTNNESYRLLIATGSWGTTLHGVCLEQAAHQHDHEHSSALSRVLASQKILPAPSRGMLDQPTRGSKDVLVLEAVESGKLELLEEYGKDALLAARGEEGMTSLLAAVRRGAHHTVRYLVGALGEGCLSSRTETGLTCLHLAAERGRGGEPEAESATSMLRLLLDDFKDRPDLPHVDARDKQSFTPVHVACMRGDVDAARCLLEHGCDVGAVNERGSTPLHWACSRGHTQVRLRHPDIHTKCTDTQLRCTYLRFTEHSSARTWYSSTRTWYSSTYTPRVS